MNRSNWTALHALCGIVGLVGAFLLYWGIASITTPGYHVSITVPWLDQTLRAVGRFIWIPAAGLLLLTAGMTPVIAVGVRSSRVARGLVGGFGVVFLAFGGFFGLVSLSVFFGVIYVSPLLLTGVALLAVALGYHERLPKTVSPS